MSCASGSCKLSDAVWGVVDESSNTLHRLTFSKPLAQHIVDTIPGNYKLRKFHYKLRDKLSKDQDSRNGLYAIVSSIKKDLVLRIGLIKEVSELMTQDDSRYLANIDLI